MSKRIIFLVGPMGAGKSTIGKRVARRLGLHFYDADRELQRHTGADPSLIFDIEGEAGFRARESAMLADLAELDMALIATGGGVVTVPENCKLLRRSGFVVFLKTDVGSQLQRLSRDRQRPLLQAPDRKNRLENLAAERDPLYASVADLVIRSERRSVGAMAKRVEKALVAQPALQAWLPSTNSAHTPSTA